MATLLVKVADSFDVNDVKDTLLSQHDYLEFVKTLRSFRTIRFSVADENATAENLESVRLTEGLQGATWDREFHVTDYDDGGEVLNVEYVGDEVEETDAQLQDTKNTRILATGSGGTIYVRVQNFTAGPRYTFSTSTSGPFNRISTFTGFLQGGTYTFDQSDSSNAGHPLRLSITPDGTWTAGGVIYSTGVTAAGTPGQSGAYTRIVIGSSTPSVLYWYNTNSSNYGNYNDSPARFGKFCVHDFWHLDRITKQNRSYMNGVYNSPEEGDGCDLYVIDTGVRGSSRPTGNNAALHPELYDPDNIVDLNGTSEQQAYRVYEVTGFQSGFNVSGYGANSNEDDQGHGTNCAICAAGIKAGVARKTKIYALKAFSSSGSGSLADIIDAYQAVIDHNDSGHPNYKGNTRPAVINASFGPTTPSGAFPYVEINESGQDAGFDLELYDEAEKVIVDNNIILVRSAGNGFTDASSRFAGPLQTRYVAGARSSGFSDNDVNYQDVNIKSISVGASDYNDRWADFSNYGSGTTTVAPGAHLTIPRYDWTANTPYTSTGNYGNISGTSFSGPIVAGIMCQWVTSNNYTLGTTDVPGLAKAFVRTSGPVSDISAVSSSAYPINTATEYKLPTDPFGTTSSSTALKISFPPAQSSVFLNKINKYIQFRVGASSLTVGGVNIKDESYQWHQITAQDPVNNTITITLQNPATGTATGGGSNNFMCIISDTHEFTDGPEFSNVTLYAELDSQEATHSGRAINNIPVHTGVDFDASSTNDVISKVMGMFNPFIPKTISWYTSAGDLTSGQGYDNGDSVNVQLGIQTIVSYASEPFTAREYSLSGDDISSTGLTFSTSSGVLSGTVTSSYQDLTFNITVTEVKSGESRSYSFQTNGTGVLVFITTQPVDQAIEAGAGTAAVFGPLQGYSSDGSTVTYQWQYSTDNGANWANVTQSDPAQGGHGGETTDTLTVADDFTFNGYQYRCILNSGTAVQTTTSNVATLSIYRTITVSSDPQPQSVVAPAAATFTIVASTADSATLSYQWRRSTTLNGTYFDISGATAPAYTTPATTYANDNSTFFKCNLSVDGSSSVLSTAAELTVTRTVVITTQPANATGSIGGTRTFSVVANTSDNVPGDLTYQWQLSIDDGSNWSNIAGATTNSYTTGTLTASEDDYRYRVLIAAAGAPTVTSDAAILQVETVSIAITLNPQPQTVNEGQTATFTANGNAVNSGINALVSSSFGISQWDSPAGGGNQFEDPEQQLLWDKTWAQIASDHTPSVTFQWQRSDDQGVNWSDINGATSNSYTTPNLTYGDDHDDRYRCKIDAVGADAPAFTSAALLTVFRTHSVQTEPSNQTGNEGGTATFTVVGQTSSGTQTFQWQRSDDTVNYSDISGATSASYTTPNLVFADDNESRYRCVLSLVGSQAPVTSTYAVLTVNRVITIDTQPTGQAVIEGNRATFTIAASITSGTVNYQWQISTDNGANWTNISGANSTSYQTEVLPFPTLNRKYRCVLSNTNAITVTSDAAALTVNEAEFVDPPSSVNVNVDADTGLTFNRQPTFNASAFNSQYAGSTHAASFWQIKRVSDNVIIYDTSAVTVPDLSQGDPINLTSFTVPVAVLDFDTLYQVAVKYKDNAGLTSPYSTPIQFQTPKVDQPEIQTITPAFNPTINVITPAIKTGYQHVTSDWQFSQSDQFTDIIHQSLGNSTNLLSYTLPGDVVVLPLTTYYVRVRFNVDVV